MASGDIIGWQNSDDYYLPGAFQTVVEIFETQPKIDVVYGDVIIVDEDDSEVDRLYNIPPSAFVQRYWSLFSSNQATFFRTTVFDEVGLLSEELNLTMDADLFWRLLREDIPMYHVSAFVGAFRKQPDAKTHDQSVAEIREELKNHYHDPWYEQYLPQIALRASAISLKAYYLAKEGRWDAFVYNARKRFQATKS
jgi:GT2 family glycosyltransferase